MKKRIRKTGEIVDVVTYSTPCGAIRNECDSVSYVDSQGNEHDRELGLNIFWDFESVEGELTTEIDWEHRRYETAKAAMIGLMAGHNAIYEAKKLAPMAIEYADALIAELKKGGKND